MPATSVAWASLSGTLEMLTLASAGGLLSYLRVLESDGVLMLSQGEIILMKLLINFNDNA